MDDLVTWLRAALDDDERAARRLPEGYRLYVCDGGRQAADLAMHHPAAARPADGRAGRLPGRMASGRPHLTEVVKGCNDPLQWELISPDLNSAPAQRRGLRRIQGHGVGAIRT